MAVDWAQQLAEQDQRIGELERQLAERTRERDEGQVREQAVARILRLLSASTSDQSGALQAILQAMVETNRGGTLYLMEAGRLRHIGTRANHAQPPRHADGEPHPEFDVVVDPASPVLAAMLQGRTVYVPDVLAPGVASDPGTIDVIRQIGHRTYLVVPMVSAGEVLGCLMTSRSPIDAFPEAQRRLLEVFADQAAIAITNARRFHEVQERNRELSEALEQQTATSEILRVMSQSPSDYLPMLDTLAHSAGRVCAAEQVLVCLRDHDETVIMAVAGPMAGELGRRQAITPDRIGTTAMHKRCTIQVASEQDPRLEAWSNTRHRPRQMILYT